MGRHRSESPRDEEIKELVAAGVLPSTVYCSRCQATLPASEFYLYKTTAFGAKLSGYCRICQQDWARASFGEAKARAVAYKGGECQECGYKRSMSALEFHHRDRTTKTMRLDSRKIKQTPWPVLQAELDLCDMLCSNCHRETEDVLLLQHREDDLLRSVEELDEL